MSTYPKLHTLYYTYLLSLKWCSDNFPAPNILFGNDQTMHDYLQHLMYKYTFSVFAGMQFFKTKFKGFIRLHVLHKFCQT